MEFGQIQIFKIPQFKTRGNQTAIIISHWGKLNLGKTIFKPMLSRRLFLFSLLAILSVGCSSNNEPLGKLTIGVVNLEENQFSLEPYLKLKDYLSGQLRTIVDLEPTYNELKALDQIQRQRWDLVFAPSGLTAVAIAESQYRPIFPLEGGLKTRSAIVVLEKSPLSKLSDLNGKVIALGQPGSSTAYYLPIYNLYGLTIGEIRFAPTPKEGLHWLAQQEVEATAISIAEFNKYRTSFPNQQFRVLYTDSHDVPSGAVLLAPEIEANREEKIRQALINAPPTISASINLLTNAPIPEYDYLIEVVERVRPLADKINGKPVQLY